MSAEPEQLSIPTADGSSVTALLYLAVKNKRVGTTVILGHGAGAGQLHPFMRLFAAGLAERGIDALTFNFPYMDQGRKVPDPKAKLEACYLSVIKAALENKKLKGNRLVIGGKSMGGRISSQVAAALESGALHCGGSTPLSNVTSKSTRKLESQSANSSDSPIAGLVFLGYPLHPPGKPDQLRDAHLPLIKAPMLFIQGSRDAFGSAEEIRATIKKHHLPATLHVVEGGDHSLKVPKAVGITQDQVYVSTIDFISGWIRNEVR
jgi:predicted alpha/beta-hydrolase family hydrolase